MAGMDMGGKQVQRVCIGIASHERYAGDVRITRDERIQYLRSQHLALVKP